MSSLINPNKIEVEVRSTKEVAQAKAWLEEYESGDKQTIALDFEASAKYSEKELAEALKKSTDMTLSLEIRLKNRGIYEATPLSHSSHVLPTHISLATVEDKATVFIIDSYEMLQLVFNWITSTHMKQVWHNALFDLKLVYYYTKKFPYDFEDTAVLAKHILNHVDVYKANVKLKHIGNSWFGDWAISSDKFHYSQMYKPTVVKYSGIDACATIKAWNVMVEYLAKDEEMGIGYTIKSRIRPEYAPIDILPLPPPKTQVIPYGYFYDNVAKHLIKDIIRVMDNGLPVDLQEVKKLDSELITLLDQSKKTLESNEYVSKYMKSTTKTARLSYRKERLSKCKSLQQFIKPFNGKDMVCRSYFMQEFIKKNNITATITDEVLKGIPKWTIKLVKAFTKKYPILQRMLDNKLNENNSILVKKAVYKLAKDKKRLANRRFVMEARTYSTMMNHPKYASSLEFNPASPIHKHGLFTDLLGYASEKETDAYKKYERNYRNATRYNKPLPDKPALRYSWSRDNIIILLKTVTDSKIAELCKAMIDYSFGAVVKSNFIKSAYKYTIDGRIYGNLKMFGAKSFRLTSNNPNLLNMPSTKSRYSKPVKKCLIAPKGFIVLTADYGALEDRVLANLSEDKTKCDIFLKGLDGHSLNAYGYFKDEVAQHMEITGDLNTDVKNFYELKENGNSALSAIRQRGKPVTFGLSYGAMPPKVAESLKISIPAAEKIYNSYHHELYPGITKYREEYVLPTALKTGRLHLGMGCYIRTDDANKDIRTLHNASCQFWSILSLLSINKLHQRIDEAGLQKSVICVSSIYDSIYCIVKDDFKTIQWANNNLIDIMTKHWIKGEIIPNEATAEIGYNWAKLHKLPNNATFNEISCAVKEAKADFL